MSAVSTTPATEPSTKRPRCEGSADAVHPFGFPFRPYSLQLDFMQQLYRCLDEGGVGVFESPTGTGKSLSLICGALRWQLDRQSAKECELLEQRQQPHRPQTQVATATFDDDGLPAWVNEWFDNKELAKARSQAGALVEAREKRIKRLARYYAGARRGERAPSQVALAPKASTAAGATPAAPDEFDLDEWDAAAASDEAAADGKPVLLELSDVGSSDSEDDEDAANRPWRVLYCSRTHSQLAQVVGEVRKTEYGEKVSVVSLGSRRALCTNESVRTLPGGSERVNDACLELQSKSGGKKKAAATEAAGGGCPYHKPKSAEQREARQAMADRLLTSPLDVEELGALGRREGCCAYYAARGSLADAQLILLPYALLHQPATRHLPSTSHPTSGLRGIRLCALSTPSMPPDSSVRHALHNPRRYASLLHAGTRESLGISLRRSVVIIDEAHNLIDTINETHSVTLTARHLSEVAARRLTSPARIPLCPCLP